MNLLNYLYRQIHERKMTKAEAIRFIYLYTCEKYSFDYRFQQAVQSANHEAMAEILDYKPDIKNEKFKDITCVSYCESILGPLIERILDEKVEYVGSGFGHRYLIVPFYDDEVILDATENDLTRVKLNMSTVGFESASLSNMEHWNKTIKNIDKKLGYIKDDYLDEQLKARTDVKDLTGFADVCGIIFDNYKLKKYNDAKAALREIFDVLFNDQIELYTIHTTAYRYDYLGIYYIDGMYYKLYKDGYYKFKPMMLTEFYAMVPKYDLNNMDEILNPNIKTLKSL